MKTSKYKRWSVMGMLMGLFLGLSTGGAAEPAKAHQRHTAAADAGMRPGGAGAAAADTRVLDLGALTDIDALVEKLAERRVVFVGETHNRYDHHLNQLAIVKGLYRRHPDLAVGLEFFQQPFQKYLDRYIAGSIDERTLLQKTEYFERWRYDYRLYRPVIRFARARGIPLVALNVPRELTEKVSAGGLEGLTEAERSQVPADMARGDVAYRERIRKVFEQHPNPHKKSFEHFFEAQLLWDEGMSARVADYLKAHPGGHMVVLAGTGHLEYGQGIPARLRRRVAVETAIVINGEQYGIDPALGDYLLITRQVDLPRNGLLGVMLDSKSGGVTVDGFSDHSPSSQAGLEKGDRIMAIGGTPVKSYSDIRLALMDQAPGTEVRVEVLRKHMFLEDEYRTYMVKLF